MTADAPPAEPQGCPVAYCRGEAGHRDLHDIPPCLGTCGPLYRPVAGREHDPACPNATWEATMSEQATAIRRAWDWRKASAGWTLATDRGEHGRLFHAYDVNDNAACDAAMGLMASCEPVNEGSHLCPDCMTIVRRQPQGRPEREYVDA